MISPYSFLTISLLVIFAKSQFCCKDSSACPSQASCLCQYPIDSCIFEIIENSLSFPVTTSQSYFNWVPSTNEYISVTIEICSENKDSLKAGFKIQNQDAKGYPTESNIFFSTSTQKCYELYIASPKFCQSPSGGYCNLILSLALTNSSPLSNKTVQISVSYVQGLTKYIVFILIAIGCVLLLAIIILLACMIRKKMVENSVVEKKQIYTIDHLQQHTSKGKYSDLKKEERGEGDGSECCSVCLTQIQNEDIVRKTPCGHIFHTDCVDLWCIRNLTCPICRQPLDEQSLKKKTSLKTQELSINQLMIPTQQNQQLNQRVGATLNNLIHRRNRITMVDLIRNRRNQQNSVEGSSNCQ